MPSALEHYATTLRDPAYWRLNKRLLNAFNVALKVLQPYAHNQLYFPGVEVMDVEVKKMQTYFDYFEFDVTNSVTTNAIDSLIHVNIGQPRLNHKPFSIMINVASLVAQKALVKIFIGPKFNLADIGLIKDTLKQLDSFEYDLNIGANKIVRKSDQINDIAGDYLSLRALLKQVEAAELGLEPLYFTNIESIVGYPSRLILPKGTADGFPLQLYVIIAPFIKTHNDGVVEREFNTEILSYGYPFDRPIEDPKLFDLSNTMIKDILITHKGDDKVYNYGGEGASKKWYSTGAGRPAYDPEQKPTYGKKTEYKKFDYSAKKGNYEGKTFDYTAKKGNYANKQTGFSETDEHVITESTTPEPIPVNVLPLEVYTTTEIIITNSPVSEILDKSESTEPTESQDNILPKINSILAEGRTSDSDELNIENIHPLLKSSPYDYADKKEKTIKKYIAKKEKQDQKRIKIQAKKNSTIDEIQIPNANPVPITVEKVLPIDDITIGDEKIADPMKSKIIIKSKSWKSSEELDDVDSKISSMIQKQEKNTDDIKTKDWHPTLSSGPYDYMTKKEKRVNESIGKKEKAIDKHETKQLKYQTKYNRTVTEAPTVEPIAKVLPIDDVITTDDLIPSIKPIIVDAQISDILDENKNIETTDFQDSNIPKINLINAEEKITDSGEFNIDQRPVLRSSPYDYTAKKEKAIKNYTAKKEKQEQKRIKIQAKKNGTIDEIQITNIDPLAPIAIANVLPVDDITIANAKKSKINMESSSSESSEDLDDAISKRNYMTQKQTKVIEDIKTEDWHPVLKSSPYDYMTKKEKRANEGIGKKENAIVKHETKQLKYQTKYNPTITEEPTIEPAMRVLPIDDVITRDNLIPSKKTFKKEDSIANYENVNTDTDRNDYEDLNEKLNREVISTSLEDSDSTEAVNKYNIGTKEDIPRFTEKVYKVGNKVRYVDEIDFKNPLHLDDYITWIGLHHFNDEPEVEPVYY